MIKYFTLTLLIIGVLLFSVCKKTRENIGKSIGSSIRKMAQDAQEQSEKSQYKKEGLRPEDCFDDPKVISLCHAIIEENVTKMEQLITDGADVNAMGKLEFLFHTTNNIRYTGKKEIPLLVYAFPFGENVLQCLLEHGADPNGYIITPLSEKPNHSVYKKRVISVAIDYLLRNIKFKNYVNILLKYGVDPELDTDFSPLIQAAKTTNWVDEPDQPFSGLVTLVESGVDLNRETDKNYAVTSAARTRSFLNLLYLLERGAAYTPETIPGGELQRILYKYQQEMLHQWKPEQRQWHLENPDGFEEVVKWLEAHGVSFDKPVPPEESTQKPEPFRVTKPKWQK
jgi:ankyrin repeat protein